jgi:hypothetical protein
MNASQTKNRHPSSTPNPINSYHNLHLSKVLVIENNLPQVKLVFSFHKRKLKVAAIKRLYWRPMTNLASITVEDRDFL